MKNLSILIAYNYGDTVEDPWFGSVLSKREPIVFTEEVPDVLPDLTNIPDEDKITYSDIDYKPEDRIIIASPLL